MTQRENASVPFMEREAVLARVRERIVAYAAYRMAGDVAEDVAQEVMLVIHEKYGHVERLEELLPLSIQIARFKIAGFLRKVHRRGEHSQVSVDEMPLADSSNDPAAILERKERLERLAAALRRLGKRCRELFRLKLEGKSFGEIREILGAASINTIYTWDFRCRKELLERMGGSWEESR